MFSWLKRLFRRQPLTTLPTIEADDTGFSLTHRGHTTAFPWQAVTRIAAYKQDLHTYDRIVLLIETLKNDTRELSLSEDCPGFATLFGPMERELGLNPSWYLDIMTPAFEPTPTVLYLRSLNEEGGEKEPV